MNFKEQYSKQVEREVKQFRKGVERINSSDHPTYDVDGTREYEIHQLKESMESRVAEIEREFNDKIEKAIESQSKVAARSSFYVSPADRTQVDNYIQDLLGGVTFATNNGDKGGAFAKFESNLDMLDSEGALYEVKRRLPELASKLNDDSFSMRKLRGMFHTFDALKKPEQEQLEALKDAKLHGVTHKYRTLRMTHPAYKHEQSARKSKRH
ncbi:hypothetical protein V1502_16985 [Bacillus sp. SCS-153A]|uniref:hypothetical protein n=1 Tax=Rossellomorea sedimentorum TaxID=3115294 RepID=UPI00390629C9